MGLRFIVTGSQGQLGRCLVRRLSEATEESGALVAAWSHKDLDIGDADAVAGCFDALPGGAPDVLVNAAAYNAVDACEGEGADAARRVNSEGPGHLGRLCEEAGVRLVHVSTDYVLAGDGTAPYPEDATPAPKSVYGESKLAGEWAVQAASPDALVVRTSWVFGPGRNFVGAILRQGRRRRAGEIAGPLSVVDDQVGCPTYAADLADGLLALVAATRPSAGQGGVYHLSNASPSGQDSWWDFARGILDSTGYEDLEIVRGRTEDLGLAAARPAYSVLGCERAAALGVKLRPWRDALAAYLASEDLQTTLDLTDPGYWEERQRGAAS